MDESISRAEHEEYVRRVETEHKRMQDENDRQNKRLEQLENNMNQIIVQQLTTLTTTIKSLEISVGNMIKVQEQQGKRLEALESRDGELWRKAIGYVATAIIGIVVGFIFRQIGM